MTALFDDVDSVDNPDSLVGHQFKTDFDENGKLLASLALSRMYTAPEAAVLREYTANALDATAGMRAHPTEVVLPTRDNPVFEVRDFGPGMPFTILSDKFFQFNGSNKTGDEEQIGAFGFGSKAAYAVSNGWCLVNIHKGRKTVVTCSLASNGVRTQEVTADEFVEHDPDNHHTRSGVHIIIPLRENSTDSQIEAWRRGAEILLPWFPQDRLAIRHASGRKLVYGKPKTVEFAGVTFVEKAPWTGTHVLVNGVLYRFHEDTRHFILNKVREEFAKSHPDYAGVLEAMAIRLEDSSVVLMARESEVDISPTRESVISGSKTTEFATRVLTRYMSEVVDGLDGATAKPTIAERVVAVHGLRKIYKAGSDEDWASALSLFLDLPLGPRGYFKRKAASTRLPSSPIQWSKSQISQGLDEIPDLESSVRVRDVIQGPAHATIITGCARKIAPPGAVKLERMWKRAIWWIPQDSTVSRGVGDLTLLLDDDEELVRVNGKDMRIPAVMTYALFKTFTQTLSVVRPKDRPSVEVVHFHRAPGNSTLTRTSSSVELRNLNSYLRNNFDESVPKIVMSHAPYSVKGVERVVIARGNRQESTVTKAVGAVALSTAGEFDEINERFLTSQAESFWHELSEAERRTLRVFTQHGKGGMAVLELVKRFPDAERGILPDGAAAKMLADARAAWKLFEDPRVRDQVAEVHKTASDDPIAAPYEAPVLLTMIPTQSWAESFVPHMVGYLNSLQMRG